MTTITKNTKPALPKTDAEAIAFALDHLHDHERTEFLQEWRAGKDVSWALEVIVADGKQAA